jgi:hypothetical protein
VVVDSLKVLDPKWPIREADYSLVLRFVTYAGLKLSSVVRYSLPLSIGNKRACYITKWRLSSMLMRSWIPNSMS